MNLQIQIILCLLLFSEASSGQNGFLAFSNTADNTTATTGNTGFSGVRVGTGGGGFTIANPGQEIGSQAELKGIAPSSASINSVGIASSEYGTAAQTFTVSFDVFFTGGSSGTWYFFAGNGATFGSAQSSSFSSTQVFTGLRMVFGSSSTITTNFRNSSGTWTASGISGTPFAQDVAYTVTIVGNNSSSTVNYGASQSVATNTFDFWVNGSLVGNDLSKNQLAGTTDINAFRFYGESSTSNVATIYLDNIKWWNTCEAPSMSVYSNVSSIPANTYTDLFVNNGTGTLGGNVTIAKNLYYTSGTVNLSGHTLSYASGATLQFTPASSTVTTNNSIFPASSGPTNLVVNNSNHVTLHAARSISGTLTLTEGTLHTSSSNTITYGSLSGGSSGSYVQGPQVFTTASTSTVTVHCGKAGSHRAIQISPSSTSSTTWTVEYFRANPSTVFGSSLGVGLNNISTQEYFQIDRSGATPADANLTIPFETNSHVGNLTDLRVVRWNGSQWVDHGNGATSGSTSSGTVTTSAAVSSFSPFTIGSSSASNPLPVQWLYFNAKPTAGSNLLEWATASESNNSHFILERNIGNSGWTEMAHIAGAGYSSQLLKYQFVDLIKPSGFAQYCYRLKQVDFNGESSEAGIRCLENETQGAYAWLGENPATNWLILTSTSDNKTEVSCSLLSAQGQVLAQSIQPANDIRINISSLKAGSYLLQLHDDTSIQHFRFVKH